MVHKKSLLVFTDMDGTLLDHESYCFDAAIPALRRLRAAHIPVIPVTSKTRAELIPLMQRMGLTGPFVVENGAGIYIPKHFFKTQPAGTEKAADYWCFSQAPPRAHWLAVLQTLKPKFPGAFTHFSEMGISGVQAATGLSASAAALACQRDFGEPVQWLGGAQARDRFVQACIDHGAQVLEGGRFMHVAGASDKGEAVRWLCRAFHAEQGLECETLGLGDSLNDVALLEAVDHAVIIKGVKSAQLQLQQPPERIERTQQPGPIGWHQAVTTWLDARGITENEALQETQ